MAYNKERLFVLAAIIITTGNVLGAFKIPTPVAVTVTLLAIAHFRKRLVIIYKTLPRDVEFIRRLIQVYAKLRKYEQNDWTVVDLFRTQLDKHPHKVCFYFKDQKWTFADVEQLSNSYAHVFQKAGFKKGDVLALFMGNRVEYICLWFGLSKIGVITALINTNVKNQPLVHCFKAGEAQAIIFSEEYRSTIDEISDQVPHLRKYQLGGSITGEGVLDLAKLANKASKLAPIVTESIGYKDNLMYIYTSGTTGLPKAAIIPHFRFLMVSLATRHLMKIEEDDIVYNPMPLYHSSGGMLGTAGPLCHGYSAAIREKFSASAYWPDCIKYNCTVGQYIGEMCRYIQMVPPRPEDTQHKVRKIFGNGMRPNLWKDFVERFKIDMVCELYGSTEGNANIVTIDKTVGAVGFLPMILPAAIVPMGLIKVTETGEPLRDEQGFCIRCGPNEPGMFIGMISNSDATREYSGYVADLQADQKKVIHHVFKKGDKAFLSGDLLVMDELGYLYFKDRTGDTFRWKGENVSTTEVEGVITSVAGLRDVVVYGVEVGNLEGRAGMATIVDPDGKLDLIELSEELDRTLPTYARPPFLRVTDHADMTGTFKLKKVDLQKEGFDPDVIKDKLYFRTNNSQYFKLTKDVYNDVTSGKIRI